MVINNKQILLTDKGYIYKIIHVRDTYLEDEWRLGDKHNASEKKRNDHCPEEAARFPQKQERHNHHKHGRAENDGGGVA